MRDPPPFAAWISSLSLFLFLSLFLSPFDTRPPRRGHSSGVRAVLHPSAGHSARGTVL